jgi:hypothetical protein
MEETRFGKRPPKATEAKADLGSNVILQEIVKVIGEYETRFKADKIRKGKKTVKERPL